MPSNFSGGVGRAISFASARRSRAKRASFAVGLIARFLRRLCWAGRAGHGRRTVSTGSYSAKGQRGARTSSNFSSTSSPRSSAILVQRTECQCRPALPAAQGIAHHHRTQSSRDDDDTVLAGSLLHSHPRIGPLPRCDAGLREHGPKPAIAVLTKILAKAKQAGEVDLADCEAGARQFLGMLHGKSIWKPCFSSATYQRFPRSICAPA